MPFTREIQMYSGPGTSPAGGEALRRPLFTAIEAADQERVAEALAGAVRKRL